MKITAKNLVEKWDEIKGKMPDYVTEPSAAYLEFADIYDDLDEDTISKFDAWLADVNEALAKSDKPKKDKKPAKPQVGESPAWLTTLKSFVKSFAGQTKDTWRVRKYVMEIQANFDAKRGGKTPHIDIIREIQDKLLPFANKDAKKVDIPKYDDLVSKCKSAINGKDFTVSKKAKKHELKKESLSGFRIGFSK